MMADRIEMVHSLTGTLMFVPVELVPAYEKAGHKRTAPVDPAEEGETNGDPAEEDKPKKNK